MKITCLTWAFRCNRWLLIRPIINNTKSTFCTIRCLNMPDSSSANSSRKRQYFLSQSKRPSSAIPIPPEKQSGFLESADLLSPGSAPADSKLRQNSLLRLRYGFPWRCRPSLRAGHRRQLPACGSGCRPPLLYSRTHRTDENGIKISRYQPLF